MKARYMPKDGYMGFVDDGKKFGYNECCIELFDKLIKHGVSPAISMDWLFGKDSCKTHVRCQLCRDKHVKEFPVSDYARTKLDLEILVKVLHHDMGVIKRFDLLSLNNLKKEVRNATA